MFKHLIYVWHGCGMQFERFYSLNDSVLGSFPHLHHVGFQQTLPNLGKPLCCGGNGVSVLPYPHPQLFKVFKHLIYVWHGCGMQFERFYSLNDSVVGSFPHWHNLGFQQTVPNLGKPLWWQRCECAAISPSTTRWQGISWQLSIHNCPLFCLKPSCFYDQIVLSGM